MLSSIVGEMELHQLLEVVATVGDGDRLSLRAQYMQYVSATWKHYTRGERTTLELVTRAKSFAVQSETDYARLRGDVRTEDDYVRMRRRFDEQYPRYTQLLDEGDAEQRTFAELEGAYRGAAEPRRALVRAVPIASRGRASRNHALSRPCPRGRSSAS